MTEILIGKIQWPFLAEFLSDSLLGVSATSSAEKSDDESGMIRTQMWRTVDQKIVVDAWDALCGTTP
jgi:hypothetical protein